MLSEHLEMVGFDEERREGAQDAHMLKFCSWARARLSRERDN